MTTYKRSGNSFCKVDEDMIKCISLSIDEVSIKICSGLPEDSYDIKEEDYVAAVCAATKYGFVGDRPDIPPPPSE